MNLIDSSVWIGWIRGVENPACRLLGHLLREEAVCVTPLIVQGARSPVALRELEAHFSGLPVVFPRYQTHLDAAALAVEHELPLLTNDRDFMAIADIEPRLKLLET